MTSPLQLVGGWRDILYIIVSWESPVARSLQFWKPRWPPKIQVPCWSSKKEKLLCYLYPRVTPDTLDGLLKLIASSHHPTWKEPLPAMPCYSCCSGTYMYILGGQVAPTCGIVSLLLSEIPEPGYLLHVSAFVCVYECVFLRLWMRESTCVVVTLS